MIRSLLLATAMPLLFSPAFADEKKEPVLSGDETSDDAARALNDFISRAVEDGLLDRPGTSKAQQVHDENAHGAPDEDLHTGCAPTNVADFSPYKDFEQYSDLTEFEASGTAQQIERIQVRIALGLYSEARSLNKTLGLQNSYLNQIATLLEDQSSSTAEYFGEYAACNTATAFWHSVAQLAAHQEAGSAGIEERISYFRSLPKQLRKDIVTIAVPALDGFDERLVAKKLLTSFSAEDVANSKGLQFASALLNDNAEVAIDEFIVRPEFRLKALGAIVQRGDTLSTPQRELLLEELAHIIKRAPDEHELTIAVKFALQEFGARSNYAQMIKLAQLSELQSPVLQNLVFQKMAAVISHNLESEDQLTVLAAFQALVDHSETFEKYGATAALYETAAKRAKELGYKSLANLLANRDLRQQDALLQSAEIAFRKNNTAQVYALADRLPGEPELALIAAKAALQVGDADKLKAYEASLLARPELSLQLIKEDAAQGKWLVSENVYFAAGASEDIGAAANAANILALRRSALAARVKSQVSLSAAEQILSRSTKDLHPKSKEVN